MMEIKQQKADELFEMRKLYFDKAELIFPHEGSSLVFRCYSQDKRYEFQADVNRKGQKGKQLTYLHRYNETLHLRRLDFAGPPHCNPPETYGIPWLEPFKNIEIPCPHMHIYIENFYDKWAIPLAKLIDFPLKGNETAFELLEYFLNYCNIEIPKFRRTLFDG